MPPQVTTVIDNFNRANGTLNAGTGSTIWSASQVGGGTGNWNVVSNAAAPSTSGANHLSSFTLPADMELVFTLPTTGGTSDYIAVFFALQSATGGPWEGYWFIYDATNWKINKRVAGTTTTVATTAVAASGHSLAAGDRVWIHRVGSVIRVRHYRVSDGAWTDTPVIETTDTSISAVGTVGLEATGAYTLDDLIGGAAVAEGGGGGGVSGITLYVDADDPAASDALARTSVTASTPLKTLAKACSLALASPTWADNISVRWAANANPLDPKGDTSVYAGWVHGGSGTFLASGANAGNMPIVVTGVSVSGQRPKTLGITASTLHSNWQYENLHFGYDFDSGLDNLTAVDMQRPGDLTWTNCVWTGGGGAIINATGQMLWEDCDISALWSVFKSSGGRDMDGAGFRISNNSQFGDDYQCDFVWRRCEIHHVEGQDGFQLGTGTATQVGVTCLWEECYWHHIVQAGDDGSAENPAGVHTDSVQILGGPSYEFVRCVWTDNSNSIIASDFHQGTIRLVNCMIEGAAVNNPGKAGFGLNIRGADRLEIISCTIVNNGFQSLGVWCQVGKQDPTIETTRIILNSIIDGISDSGMIIKSDSEDAGNVVGVEKGDYTISPDSQVGVVEFGSTVATDLELANTPTISIARDAGIVDVRIPTLDRIGRARTGSAPDAGAHESPTDVTITPNARPPIVMSFTPLDGEVDVSATANVTAVLYPMPGATIDSASITASTTQLIGPNLVSIPAVRTVSAPDTSGRQTVTLDPNGDLYPFVRYSVLFDGLVADTFGNSLGSDYVWSFEIGGPAGPAVYDAGSAPGATYTGWIVGSFS